MRKCENQMIKKIKNKSQSCPPVGGWFYGTKHEWLNFKIYWNKKSKWNNRTYKFDLQFVSI